MNRGRLGSSFSARRSSCTHEVSASSLTATPFQTLAKRPSFETGAPACVTSSLSTSAAFGVSRTSPSPDHNRPVAMSNLNVPPKRTL